MTVPRPVESPVDEQRTPYQDEPPLHKVFEGALQHAAGSQHRSRSHKPNSGRDVGSAKGGAIRPRLHPGENGLATDVKETEMSYSKDSVFHNRVELYRGSVSVVYKATCATTKREVIVKAYKIHRMTSKQIHKTKREISLMRMLRGDPGVVRYLGHFEDEYMTFIVMEHCKQGDLFRNLFLKGGSVDEHWATTKVIAPLLKVLTRLHAKNILHRDIKPENIFLTSEWKLKLGDFGLALDASEEHAFTRSGTLDYMAPEVLANPTTDLHEGPYLPLATLQEHGVKPYNDKVDIWAVGILSYELVVGRPPFEVENEQYTMRLIMNSNRITYPIQFSKEWADFVSLTLNKKPDMRPSAAKLLQHPWILKHVPRDGMKDGGECPTSLNVQNGVAAGSVTQPAAKLSFASQKLPSALDSFPCAKGHAEQVGTPPAHEGKSASSFSIMKHLPSPSSAAGSPLIVARFLERPKCVKTANASNLDTSSHTVGVLETATQEKAISTKERTPQRHSSADSSDSDDSTGLSGLRARIKQYFQRQAAHKSRTNESPPANK